MAQAKDPLNPLGEISLLFGRDGLAHKDLESLTDAISDLISTLEKRTGKTKDKEKEEPVVGNLFKDIKDFSKGFFDTAFKNPYKYAKNTAVVAKDFVVGKSTMPDNLGKVETPEETIPQVEEQNRIEPTLEKVMEPAAEPIVSKEYTAPKIEPIVSKEDTAPKIEPILAKEDTAPKIEPILAKEDTAPKIEPILDKENKVEPVFDTKAFDPITLPQVGMVESKKENDNTLQTNSDNKILSDMVEVLIDLRDDKSQKQMLSEAIAIRKIISDQAKKVELPGGLEPNSEEAKQEDREKLAEAIARRLSDVIGNLGNDSGLNIPDLPNRPDKSAPPKPKGPKGGGSGGSKLSKIMGLGGKLLGGASLAYSAYEASEFLRETGYGDKMNEGAGKAAEAAFRENVAPTIDPNKADISAEEAKAALENGSPRDIEKLGGKEALENIVKNKTIITSNYTTEEANNARANYARIDPRRTDVAPKETQLKLKDMLNQVNEENTQLKMYTESQSTQTLAPIVSNKTINNTEQTIVGATPSPHPTTNSFMRWQNKRSAYTD